MKHHIDPKVDYPFKAILGANENRDVLIDFLNGVLQLDAAVVEVEILNPFTPAEFEDGRAGIIDVKARDSTGRLFQVEIQNQTRPRLIPRMLCTWADLYASQMERGGDYARLQPAFSVWILDENLLPTPAGRPAQWHHTFELRDQRSDHRLTDQLAIHTVELQKWTRGALPLDSESRWIYFLRDAGSWDRLPAELDLPPLRKAMAVLERISEKQEDYYRYLSRLDFEREQRTIEHERRVTQQGLEEAREAEAQAREAEAQAREAEARERGEKERVLAEAERLRARLRELGLDPDPSA